MEPDPPYGVVAIGHPNVHRVASAARFQAHGARHLERADVHAGADADAFDRGCDVNVPQLRSRHADDRHALPGDRQPQSIP